MINDLIAQRMHEALMMAANAIQKEFNEHNLPYVNLEISVTGSTHSELKLEYSLGKSNYGEKVTGGSIDRVLLEVIRRAHWQTLNASLSLPKPCDFKDDED